MLYEHATIQNVKNHRVAEESFRKIPRAIVILTQYLLRGGS